MKPHHKALMITEDHRLIERNFVVDSGFLVDHRANRSWSFMPRAVIRMRGTRTPYVLLYERAGAPYSYDRRRWESVDEDAVRALARERVGQAFSELPQKALQEKMASTIRLAVGGLVLTVALMAVSVLASSGNLKLPGI